MNVDELKGKVQSGFGKAEAAVGNAVGSENLKNAGAEDQLKGAAKETWGGAKDAVHSTAETVHDKAVDTRDSANYEAGKAQGHVESGTVTFRDKVVAGVDNMKNSFNDKVDDYKEEQAVKRDSNY